MNDDQSQPDTTVMPEVSETSNNDWENKYKRALADYQNLNRQHAKERQEFIKFANQNLITDLLPVLDHLQQAQSHLKDTGIDLVLKEFTQLLKSYQVEEINPSNGDVFDPNLHECIEIIENESDPQDTIESLVLSRYKWQSGQVIRHAQVRVFKSKNS